MFFLGMAFKDTYPALHGLGLTSSKLLAVATDSDNDSEICAAVGTPVVTKKAILELHIFKKSSPSCTYYTLWKWIACLFKDKWSEDNFPTIKSIRQSVLQIARKVSKLQKLPASKAKDLSIANYLAEAYLLPKVFSSQPSSIVPQSSSTCSSCSEFETVKRVNKKLCQEIVTLKDKASSIDTSDQILSDYRHKQHTIHRNLMKKVKRRDGLIQQQKDELKEGRKILTSLQERVSENEAIISSLTIKIDRLRHRASYWKKKSESLKESSDDNVIEAVCSKDEENMRLKGEIDDLEQENSDLRETVDEIIDDTPIVCFEKGKFTDNMRHCCYELLSLNVGVRNVKPIINSVLRNIAHKEVDRLPGKTVLCNMMVECLSLAQAQLGEELSHQTGNFYTLQTDGTTKHGQHFGTYDIATADTTYCLGLRHVFSGSAQNTLDTLKEILDDLDVVGNELGRPAASAKIIQKVKNTMSDRHAAEKLFCDVLSDYRAEILPSVVSGWEEMCEAEHEQLTRMNNFFCGLHFLVGLAESAEATLKAWEATLQEDDKRDQRSSGVQRLIRTACKAFHHRGSEQAGCSTHFRTYLRRQGVSKVPLAAFVGNRFNILFYDAAGVYFLRSHMEQYLSEFHGSQLNQLLQAVLRDLKTPHLVAGCQALGIIVTGPFWRYLQISTISVLDMSATYTMMKEKFDEWGCDAQNLMDNKDRLFGELTHDGDVFESLFKQSSAYTMELLQLLCKSFSLTIQRLLLDHLPGGQFHDVSDPEVITETKSVPKTNVTPERDFAVLDRLISEKPNATYIALESMLLFSRNKTTDWLQLKPPEEKEKLLQAARKLTSTQRAIFHKRREEIEEKRLKALEIKERELARKKEKELKSKEELTLKIQQIGLWTSADDVKAGLEMMSSRKAKTEALKLQLNFRKKVLNQSHVDKAVFQFSHNRHALSVEQLQSNLLTLVSGGSSEAEANIIDQFFSNPEKTCVPEN